MGERFWYQTDAGEMKRRWKLTLEAMKKEGVDALFFGGYDKWCCGITKYLTDLAVWNYPHYFLFSEQGISAFGHAGWDQPGIQPYAIKSDFFIDNVGVPTLPSTCYGDEWYPEKIAGYIRKYGYKKIGYAGFYTIPAPFYKHFTERLSEVEFVNFTDQIDHIKAVKSEWEIAEFTKCVYMHDQIMAGVSAYLRPGRTEREVSRIIRSLADDIGCPELNILAGTDAAAPNLQPYVYQNLTIGKQDYFYLLIELAGPGGTWCEIGRIFKLGDEPSAIMKQAMNDQIEIADVTARMMVPGARPADVFMKMNQMMVERGYAPESRFCSHGQGYDIVDRPMFVPQENMILEENMFIAHHPNTIAADRIGYNCDNWIITKDGAKLLSRFPRGLVQVVSY